RDGGTSDETNTTGRGATTLNIATRVGVRKTNKEGVALLNRRGSAVMKAVGRPK
ncbi:MAG: hypothetical protein GY721_01550, partial [Deltaproteobacteria bacterium]|nr:hypothetical protein [Deltaproteobacteria bacterium]